MSKSKNEKKIPGSISDVPISFYQKGADDATVQNTGSIYTHPVKSEHGLCENEECQKFLLKLNDALRPLMDPIEIQDVALRLTGEYFGVNLVHYSETGGNFVTIQQRWTKGVPGVIGSVVPDDFGKKMAEGLRAGKTQLTNDVSTDETIRKEERDTLLDNYIAAYVAVPLIKNKNWVATLAIHTKDPRTWGAQEIALLEEIAQRTWADVERAKAERALRVSEEKYRSLFNKMNEGMAVYEVVRDDSGKAIDAIYLELNPQHEKQIGIDRVDAIGKKASAVFPEFYQQWLHLNATVVETGEAVRYEQFIPDFNKWFVFNVFPFGAERFAVLYDDITVRKKAEEDLKVSELRFRTYFNLGLIGMGITLPDKSIQVVNDELCKILGYSREELLSSTCLELTHPDDVAADMVKLEAVMKGEIDGYSLNKRWIRKDGEIIETNISLKGVRNEKDEVEYFVALVEDITERKRLERNQSFLAEISQDLVTTIDFSKTVDRTCEKISRHFNAFWCMFADIDEKNELCTTSYGWHPTDNSLVRNTYRIKDYLTDEMLAKFNASQQVVINDTDTQAGAIPAAFRQYNVRSFIEIPLIRDGVRRFQMSMADNKPRQWHSDEIELLTEIASRVWARIEKARAEDAMRKSQQQLQLSLAAAKMGTFEWTSDQREIHLSLSSIEILGLKPGELFRTSDEGYLLVHPDDKETHKEIFERAGRLGESYYTEFRIIRPVDNRVVWIAEKGEAIKDDSLNRITIRGVHWDITARKEIEQALREAEEKYLVQLEKEVKERTAKLVESQDKILELNLTLQKKNRDLASVHSELTTFNDIASHDYKDTLQRLYTTMEYIVTHDARHLSNEGRANVRRAQSAIQRMKLLTEDILTYSSLHAIETEKKAVNLDEIVYSVDVDLRKTHHYEMAPILVKSLPTVQGLPVMVTLLFHHLLDNAIKFRKENEPATILISHSTATGRDLDLPGIFPDMQYTCIEVRDKGIGFLNEDRERMFKMFSRLNEKSKYRGSGIGLAVCRKIMDMHGGFIEAEGALNEGAIFRCYFPAE